MGHQNNRRHKRKSCSSKIRYNTKNGAHIALHVTKRKRIIFNDMKVYHCQYCDGWHIGRVNSIDYTVFEKLERILESDVK